LHAVFPFVLGRCVPLGTAMTATMPIRPAAVNCQVSLITSSLSEPVRRLLDYSRWHVNQLSSVGEAAKQIEEGRVPVVMCGVEDWREVLETARRSPHPPSVIVLTAAPDDAEWLQVLGAGAHYLPVQKLNAAHLFSLLNLQWRGWHKA
jgi:DNA-binding response OmpR family regulator